MSTNLRNVGLDVHAETIAVAVAEPGGEVRPLGIIPNRPEAVAKLVGKLGSREHLRVCYEAGPCGYVLYWQLTKLGVHCDVVAPTLVPTRQGIRPPEGVKPWTQRYRRWLHAVPFDQPARRATFGDYLHEVDHAAARLERLEHALDDAVQAAPASLRAVIAALQTLRGIRQVIAATIVCEVGPLSRFPIRASSWAIVAPSPRSIRAGPPSTAGGSPRLATRICAGCSWRPPGRTASLLINARRGCGSANAGSRTRSPTWPGKRSTACVVVIGASSRRANPPRR